MTENKNISGREGVISVAAILGFAAIFGIWWSSANPTARLDKIEATAIELHKEITLTYVTLREHQDLQNRILAQLAELARRDEETRNTTLTRAQFEAWKTERDMYILEIVKRMDRIRSDVHDLELRNKH